MFLDDGTKFMQVIADVSKDSFLHLQVGKLKQVAFPVLLYSSVKKP
jgi:hypothetical protein